MATLAIVALLAVSAQASTLRGGLNDAQRRALRQQHEQSAACACPRIFRPVCGADGKTWPSPCDAACAEVQVAAEGPCAGASGNLQPEIAVDPKGAAGTCPCPLILKPVCDTKNKTWPNVCAAKCNNATVAFNGTCSSTRTTNSTKKPQQGGGKPCACPLILAPVCDTLGRMWPNRCVAECTGSKVDHDGPCHDLPGPHTPLCKCTREYAPVCGQDGKTYANKCLAACVKVSVVRQGKCA